jgi:hypothetical protein
LRNDFSGVLDQRDQRVERTATERNYIIALRELPFGRKQAEGAKRGELCIH